MDSLKKYFVKNVIITALISTALIILITMLLFLVFSLAENGGFRRIMKGLSQLYMGEARETDLLTYGLIWGVLALATVVGTCTVMGARLSRKYIKIVNELQQSAEKMTEGDLDFEIMGYDTLEFDRLSQSLDSLKRRLKAGAEADLEKVRQRNMLMANISHDMRTPITTIKGYTEGLKDGIASTPEKINRYLDTIYNKTLVLERLVDNMSQYSQMELGRMQYSFAYMDIAEYMRGLSEEYENEITLQGYEYSSDIYPARIQIAGDKEKLKRVFDNLVSNAIKYNREGGSISITLQRENEGALICVKDTGKGIKQVDMPRIFDGFYRGDAARTSVKGNGLGLGISKQIVEAHKGKIWVKSEEGKGTQVFIFLPNREDDKVR